MTTSPSFPSGQLAQAPSPASVQTPAEAQPGPKCAFVLVLHGHLPDVVGHGVWPHGTDWLHEAAAETYIPFLRVADSLLADNIPFQVTIGMTPVLCEQLADRRFASGLKRYLQRRERAATKDHAYLTKTQEGGEDLAIFWRDHYRGLLDDFENRYERDLLSPFRRLQDSGHVEVISCAATHGFLPLLPTDEAIRRQLDIGLATHQRHFGRSPRGIWIPECAYRPPGDWVSPVDGRHELRRGIAEFLAERGIEFFFVETHLVRGGVSRPAYGGPAADLVGERRSPYRVYAVPTLSADVRVFARDPRSSELVWSGEVGYPGEPAYLEFHKKRFPGGHRYWAVSGHDVDLAEKAPYDLSVIPGKVRGHAEHFASLLREIGRQPDGKPSVVTGMFDFELFGHWWFEGVAWIGALFRTLAPYRDDVIPLTAPNAMDFFGAPDGVEMPAGSWGKKGDFRVWWNAETLDFWARVEKAEDALSRIAKADPSLLIAAERQVLLLQSSDWPFLIENGAAEDYARARIERHDTDLWQLVEIAERKERTDEDLEFLAKLGKADRLFEPELRARNMDR